MASATELVKECRICALVFENPKLLPCHHTFCEVCVNKMIKGSRLVCPNCRNECHARDIIPDFRLDEFLDALREQEEKLEQTKIETVAIETGNCELCGENGISHYCKDCEQCICAPCKKTHLNAKVSRRHTIESIASKNKETRTHIQTELGALKNTMTSYERTIASFQSEIDKTKAIQLSSQDELKRLREKLHQDIDKRFDALDSEVLVETENHMTRLNHQNEAYVRQFHTFQTECRNVETLINDDSQLAIQGQSILERINKMNRSAMEPTLHFKSIDLHIEQDKSWDTSHIVTLKSNPGRFDIFDTERTSKGQKPAYRTQDRRMHSTTAHNPRESLEWVSSKPWRHQHSVFVPGYPRCLRLIHGELWQCHNFGITVYDAALQQLRTMGRGDMGFVFDVASLPGGEVVLAADTGLYRMTASGERRHKIAEGVFTGVVHHADCVYAAKYRTATIHVYQHSNGWTQRHSFSVDATHGYEITLGISKDLLYACLAGNPRLVVFSLSGVLQYRTGSKGSGDAGLLNCPYICATDASGADLIGDYGNHRLQVVSARRQWSTVSLQPMLEKPRSALFFQGRLYVTSGAFLKYTLNIYDSS